MGSRPALRGFVALSVFIAVLGAAAGPAVAAERNCLTPDERRAVIAARKAVPLAQAMHLVRAKVPGEVVKVRLCRQNGGAQGSGQGSVQGTVQGTVQGPVQGLVYVLTVLARNGKVLQARVDAADGHWLGAT